MRTKTFSKILIFTLLLVGALSFLALPRLAFGVDSGSTPSEGPPDVLANLKSAGTGTGLVAGGEVAGETQISSMIVRVIQIALDFVGVIFLILMVYAGFLWMMARGNEQRIEKSKTLIEAAVIGLVIVLASYGISVFVIERITGAGGGGGGGGTSCTAPCICPSDCPSVDGTCPADCGSACVAAGCT